MTGIRKRSNKPRVDQKKYKLGTNPHTGRQTYTPSPEGRRMIDESIRLNVKNRSQINLRKRTPSLKFWDPLDKKTGRTRRRLK